METTEKNQNVQKDSQNTLVKICIIDDDKMYRHALNHQLSKNEMYKVYMFKSGEELINNLDIIRPDIVILDYRLNDSNPRAMNGVEILRRVKNLKPEVNVLMLSGQESLEVATNSVRNGAYDYVLKNENAYFKINHLIAKIINHTKIERSARKQLNYTFLMLFFTIATVLTPIIIVRSGYSGMTHWYTIAAFAVLGALMFGLIWKRDSVLAK